MHPCAIDGDVAKYTDEMKADWIWENLLAPGQRLAYLWNSTSGQKQAFGLNDLCADTPLIRGLLLAHVRGAPANAEVRYIKKGTTFAKPVPACKLGVYYGGDADINAVVNYALDCDVSQYLEELKAGLPPDESAGINWKAHVPAGELEREPERLTEMMNAAMLAFPKVGKLSIPDDKWFNASYIRLPLSPDVPYSPIGGLKSIIPDDVTGVPTLEQIKAREKSKDRRNPGKSVLTQPKDSRVQAVRNYAAKIGDVSEGHRQHEAFKVAACALKDNGLSWQCAFELIKDFNRENCKPPLDEVELVKQVNDAAEYGTNEARRLPAVEKQPANGDIEFPPLEPAHAGATLPAAPCDEELRHMYDGTAVGAFVDAVLRVQPNVKPILPITTTLVLQSQLLAHSHHRQEAELLWWPDRRAIARQGIACRCP